MRVNINGVLLKDFVTVDMGLKMPALQIDATEMPLIEKAIGKLKRNKAAYTAVVIAGALLMHAEAASAATGGNGLSGGMSIIKLMQQGAFWVGIGVSIWGLIEMGLDAPNWRGRVFKGVFLYVGVLIVPLIFVELKEALQVDVWDQMQNAPVSNELPSQPQQPLWEPTEQQQPVNGVQP